MSVDQQHSSGSAFDTPVIYCLKSTGYHGFLEEDNGLYSY